MLSGKSVLVIGLGKSGIAVTRLLDSLGAKVIVTDLRDKEELYKEIKEIEELPIIFKLGSHDPAILNNIDMVVISPGVSTDIEIVKMAISRNIPVIGELEFASRYLTFPVIAITGTNGKSTATSLLGHILSGIGKRPFIGGNIGNPLSNAVLSGEKYDLGIIEVSSFQLETINSFRPKIALFLNFDEDHLDRYRTVTEYFQAKLRIFMNQKEEDTAVLNGDDPTLSKITGIKAKKLFFGKKNSMLCDAYGNDKSMFIKDDEKIHKISLKDLKISSSHNIDIIMAVFLTIKELNIPLEAAVKYMNSFRGLPHRLEYIGTKNGIRFFNDSKATNISSVIHAISGFPDASLHLIMGGRAKGGDFNRITLLLKKKTKAIYLIGETAHTLFRLWKDKLNLNICMDMETAVKKAYSNAKPPEIILLSPGCASFDQYKNFEERGDHFKAIYGRI